MGMLKESDADNGLDARLSPERMQGTRGNNESSRENGRTKEWRERERVEGVERKREEERSRGRQDRKYK